ncbi:MAG: ribosomal RNA small subunit methyltransferase A [Candidatus Moeniiplasma glomeromycotorum]|nr:ribosomal RNA small subunit methyltransferase A [Candidatus Moeniiplasma glomeromycotorum]MCE8162508.1 ribosomal RNA small subunit methyltransferase A [Candidatus Moeniiplasma glomeromycotorum]MCE8166435.1 ribosomal RNA small subunit methyltransferase A [Candidatus Moeniiplasma glomeromycotorum]MCE8166920.1 ribosomal RNA small subunit methyltransferase A [Candidatus Moeniiplasma glomeromycotorum]
MKKITSAKIIYPPQKKLGQNFLFKESYLQKIIAAFPLDPNTIIIEIGSGYGSLTNLLAQTNCQKVISLEKDPQLFQWLTEKNTPSKYNSKENKVLFLHQDVLKVDWLTFGQEWKNNSLVVVGNLPYYLANSLIVELLLNFSLFKALVLLVQKEVAQKWVASPLKYNHHYSALSVFINYLAHTEITLLVPAGAFVPVPSVDGALVKIKPYSFNLTSTKLTAFLTFLKKCFHFRRKTLLNNLNSFPSSEKREWTQYFQQKNYSLWLRPQNLTPEEYWDLFLFSKNSKDIRY